MNQTTPNTNSATPPHQKNAHKHTAHRLHLNSNVQRNLSRLPNGRSNGNQTKGISCEDNQVCINVTPAGPHATFGGFSF